MMTSLRSKRRTVPYGRSPAAPLELFEHHVLLNLTNTLEHRLLGEFAWGDTAQNSAG